MNASDIRGLFFLDTNILVYSFDARTPARQQAARQWIRDALDTGRGVISFYQRALLLREETGFQFYDSLIVAAALQLGCSTLLSEDLQDGRTLDGLVIRNPFRR